MSKRKTTKQKSDSAALPSWVIEIGKHWPGAESSARNLADGTMFDKSSLSWRLIDQAFRDRDWSEAEQVRVVDEYLKALGADRKISEDTIAQWVRFHDQNDVEAVLDCMELVPPQQVTIIGRLPRKGSQKIVFLANWVLQQKTVVLKKLLSATIHRELRSHPLSADHPNIIKTYTATNLHNDTFLIEDHLDDVLNDVWAAEGTEQTALLLHDIGSALSYIADQDLVHGDVKPDNIGHHRGRFVLLDFGICRPAAEFTPEISATGSLRTRAPELFADNATQSIESDVWALGAVVTKVFCGRFPLIDNSDVVPRISNPGERSKFEELIAERVRSEYDNRVSAVLADCRENRIRQILESMLARNPVDRPNPAKVVEQVKQNLGYAIPEPEVDALWSSAPVKEIELLSAEYPDAAAIKRLPALRRSKLVNYVQKLTDKLRNAPADAEAKARSLLDRLSQASN